MRSLPEDHYDFLTSYSTELKELLILAAVYPERKDVQSLKEDMLMALMVRVREELIPKIEQIAVASEEYPHSQTVIHMLCDKLTDFLFDETLPQRNDFYQRIIYRLELVSKLDRLDWKSTHINVYPPVDELLIYMGYNSKTYIKLLESWLAQQINQEPNPLARIEKMQFYKKSFSQLPVRPDTILYADYHPLAMLFDQWFQYEAEFLDSQLELFKNTEVNQLIEEQHREKIIWDGSTDQLALILRAGIDAGLFVGESFNKLCQKLAPLVSTKRKEELSATSLRTKAYDPEQRDKDASRSKLQKMMLLIDGY